MPEVKNWFAIASEAHSASAAAVVRLSIKDAVENCFITSCWRCAFCWNDTCFSANNWCLFATSLLDLSSSASFTKFFFCEFVVIGSEVITDFLHGLHARQLFKELIKLCFVVQQVTEFRRCFWVQLRERIWYYREGGVSVGGAICSKIWWRIWCRGGWNAANDWGFSRQLRSCLICCLICCLLRLLRYLGRVLNKFLHNFVNSLSEWSMNSPMTKIFVGLRNYLHILLLLDQRVQNTRKNGQHRRHFWKLWP